MIKQSPETFNVPCQKKQWVFDNPLSTPVFTLSQPKCLSSGKGTGKPFLFFIKRTSVIEQDEKNWDDNLANTV